MSHSGIRLRTLLANRVYWQLSNGRAKMVIKVESNKMRAAAEEARKAGIKPFTMPLGDPPSAEYAQTVPWKDAKTEAAELSAAITEALGVVDDAISRATEPEIKKLLGDLRTKIAGATRKDQLGSLENELRTAIAAAETSGKMDTPEQQKAKLWGEIKALQDDAKKEMERLLHAGKLTQEQYTKWEELYNAANDPNRTEAERVQAGRALANETVRVGEQTKTTKIRENGQQQLKALEKIEAAIGAQTAPTTQSQLPAREPLKISLADPNATNAGLPQHRSASAASLLD